jgi:hypothetical protein
MTVKKFLINIKSVGIGINIAGNQETARALGLQNYFGVGTRHCRLLINIAGNQETARALGLQNYFGVGTRHCRVLINIAGNQETAMPFPYLIILG